MKNLYYCVIVFIAFFMMACSPDKKNDVINETYTISSPDGHIQVTIEIGTGIYWNIHYKDEVILDKSQLSLTTSQRVLGENPVVEKADTLFIDESFQMAVPVKFKITKDLAHQLTIHFEGNYAVLFRVSDEGAAYRFETNLENSVKVIAEQLDFQFPDDFSLYFPAEKRIISHHEPSYIDTLLNHLTKDDLGSLPLLLKTANNTNVLLAEADVLDYPGMFIRGALGNQLQGYLPPYVLEILPDDTDFPDRDVVIADEADYLVETSGIRSYPWRVLVITDNDAELITSQFIYTLASPNRLDDISWINPGKVAWDWWNANNVFGVDFASGINTETYKYYIDFAADFGLEYIILDEGWSLSTTDIREASADIDMDELISHGKEKGVGLILWCLWEPLGEDIDGILSKYAQWGVKGVKVDFLQRSDQYMTNYVTNVLEIAAKHNILVNFHGVYMYPGLNRTYPNLITNEGVRGGEWNKWSKHITPKHNLTIPFIRMLSGPMDYTPGAMRNANERNFRSVFERPMSQGTRAHQMAMYVAYESPLQMFADNPVHYYKEEECTRFLSRIPTIWDSIVVLEARIGEYLVIARKHNDNWYLGAMTDWTERSFSVPLTFLSEGQYSMDYIQDGINAHRYAEDYKRGVKTVSNNSVIEIEMKRGGGWLGIITKE